MRTMHKLVYPVMMQNTLCDTFPAISRTEYGKKILFGTWKKNTNNDKAMISSGTTSMNSTSPFQISMALPCCCSTCWGTTPHKKRAFYRNNWRRNSLLSRLTLRIACFSRRSMLNMHSTMKRKNEGNKSMKKISSKLHFLILTQPWRTVSLEVAVGVKSCKM